MIGYQFFHGLHRRVVAVLLNREDCFSCLFGSRYHTVALGYTYGHRFLYHCMQPGLKASYGMRFVKVIGCTNTKDIGRGMLQHDFQAAIEGYILRQ